MSSHCFVHLNSFQITSQMEVFVLICFKRVVWLHVSYLTHCLTSEILHFVGGQGGERYTEAAL